MAAETQYTASTGMVQFNTANSLLDGTGTGVTTVVTASSSSNGLFIPRVYIKSITNTVEGTLRFFVSDGTNNRLVKEIHVSQNTKSSTNPAFEYVWDSDLKLKPNWSLKVTTQYGDTFNVFVDAANWNYYTTSVRPESTNFTANTGLGTITTGNTSMSGVSATTILTAGIITTGWKGCRIDNIRLKAAGTIAVSIVRFFISDGTTTLLFKEVQVPGWEQVGTQSTYEYLIDMREFKLQAGFSILATTDITQSFAITIDACDWKYPA